MTRCSFVAVVGEPNAGKSTLVNTIVGEKVSIVSPKVQTTRRQIRGIAKLDETQVVFIDTPGFCKANTPLEKALLLNFKSSYKDSDVIILVIDATSKNNISSFAFIEKLQTTKIPFVVAINKVDQASKENIIQIADKLKSYEFIRHIFMISALKNDGIDELKKFLRDSAPEGPWLYDENSVTDMDLKFRLSEITREKLFMKLEKELPYSVYVETESFKEDEKKATIHQAIVVMKDSHKGIVLGKGGEMLGEIRKKTLIDMKRLLRKKIELKLFVKVKEKWTEKKAHLQNAGIID